MITYNENDKEISFDSWKDVVKRYPAQWVVFDKVDFDGARVNAGVAAIVKIYLPKPAYPIPPQQILYYQLIHLFPICYTV